SELTDMIHNVRDYGDVKKVVDRMMTETEILKDSGSKLQKRMQVSSNELNQLHRELEKSQKEAQTDALTGLINRRGLGKALEVERIRARQNKTPFSIILLDIDHFKRVNDNFGHLVGDSLLKGLSIIIKKQIRRNDVAVRFGGEEFLILLPETHLEGAVAVAEKLRNALSSKEWKVRESGKSMGRITASMGVATHEPDDTEESFIQRADRAVYMAKTTGRNKVFSQSDLQN
ncbi:MAG: GGDEF domain-containing protein, partial [Desulfobacterales bacterium]|nr:GGDEF domain-containing protein [Desulfobacterales bacterium]